MATCSTFLNLLRAFVNLLVHSFIHLNPYVDLTKQKFNLKMCFKKGLHWLQSSYHYRPVTMASNPLISSLSNKHTHTSLCLLPTMALCSCPHLRRVKPTWSCRTLVQLWVIHLFSKSEFGITQRIHNGYCLC